MSYTTIKAIYPKKKTANLLELGNSHGSAPVVWEAMAGKYLGVTKAYDYPNKGWMQLDSKLWDLWQRVDIAEEHRAVFMLTFDRAYVAKENFQRMSKAIRVFLADFPPKSGHVNHWEAIAKLLEGRPKAPGIGLWCTSVSEDPFIGPWNEKKEKYEPPDWKDIYELYSQIDDLGQSRERR